VTYFNSRTHGLQQVHICAFLGKVQPKAHYWHRIPSQSPHPARMCADEARRNYDRKCLTGKKKPQVESLGPVVIGSIRSADEFAMPRLYPLPLPDGVHHRGVGGVSE
jgi:hypothetical protein